MRYLCKTPYPYTEPPHWYYPARQSLGVALLRAGRLDEAEKAFANRSRKTPSNGWALKGLMEVYRQRGDAAALKAAQRKFATTWLGKKAGPTCRSCDAVVESQALPARPVIGCQASYPAAHAAKTLRVVKQTISMGPPRSGANQFVCTPRT